MPTSVTRVNPLYEVARKHIELLTGDPDTPVHIRLLDDNRTRKLDARNLHGTIAELWSEIEEAQADGFGAFIVVNAGGHSDADITGIRAAFIDCDDGRRVEDMKWHLKPSFLVSTARGWHAYWRSDDIPVERFQRLQHQLDQHYGSDDSVSNPSRVMRLAGTLHQKITKPGQKAKPVLVKLTVMAGAAEQYPEWELRAGLPDAPPSAKSEPSEAKGGPVDLPTLRKQLAVLDPFTGRGEWRNIVAGIRASNVPGDPDELMRRDLALRWSRGELGDFEDEHRRHTGDGAVDEVFNTMPPKDGGVGYGTIDALARKAGYTGPPARPSGKEVFKDVAKNVPADEDDYGGLIFLSPSQCAKLPPRKYVIKGLLAEKQVGCIFGAPGAGKSMIAPYVAYMLAQGKEVFGRRTKQGCVFYVAAEDETGMAERVQALGRRHGEAENFQLVGRCADLFSEDSAHLAGLQRATSHHRPKVIVIDTLAMAFPGLEENSSDGMATVVRISRSLIDHGAEAVLLIHHDTKANGGTPRGHSVLNGAMDMAMRIDQGEDGVVRGQLTKNRNGPCNADLAFRIEGEVLGMDEDGDPRTAGICSPHVASQRLPGLTAAEAEVWRVLEAVGGKEGLSVNDWRSEYRSTRPGCKPDTLRKTFLRSKDRLIETGWVIKVGAQFLISPRRAAAPVVAANDDGIELDEAEGW